MDGVKQALSNLKSADGVESKISAYNQLVKIMQEFKNQLNLATTAENQLNSTNALNLKKEQLSLKMNNWLQNNSAAAKQFGADIKNLQIQLAQCNNGASLNNVERAFKNIELKARAAGVATKTLGDRIATQFSKYSAYFSVASVFMYATRAIRDMFKQVKSIDAALTELKKVTDETSESYNQFLTNASSKSKEIGTTIDGLVKSTADFARLGYEFGDAQELAEVANIYAVVGDEVQGVEGATESLISTMAAFKEQADGLSNSDFALSIVDKFNEIGKLIA